jgi:hypothetical protein
MSGAWYPNAKGRPKLTTQQPYDQAELAASAYLPTLGHSQSPARTSSRCIPQRSRSRRHLRLKSGAVSRADRTGERWVLCDERRDRRRPFRRGFEISAGEVARRCCGACRRFEASENVLDMLAHGMHADVELERDLGVREAS